MKNYAINIQRQFCKCVCIIDCFEIFCERPSDLMARVQTYMYMYSYYKDHKTVKTNVNQCLIGVSPQGVISKGWGGRVSDKYLTENCCLLNCILPGDQLKLSEVNYSSLIELLICLKQICLQV